MLSIESMAYLPEEIKSNLRKNETILMFTLYRHGNLAYGRDKHSTTILFMFADDFKILALTFFRSFG